MEVPCNTVEMLERASPYVMADNMINSKQDSRDWKSFKGRNLM